MYLHEATDLLDEMYSSQDPIYYKGDETTPDELPYLLHHTILARDVRISYYGREPLRLVHGSLSGMVMDRKQLLGVRWPASHREDSADAVRRVNAIIDRLHERTTYPKWLMKSLRRLVLELESR